MDEYVELLDRRSLDGLEPKRAEHLRRDFLHLEPRAHIAPDEVLGAFGLLCLHMVSPSRAPTSADALPGGAGIGEFNQDSIPANKKNRP